MSKKNKTQKNSRQEKTVSKSTAGPVSQPATAMATWLLLGIILLLTFIVYFPALQNGFVWDDQFYIQDNPLIRSVDLKKIFSTNVIGSYNPITIVAYALEYKFSGLNNSVFHGVNLFFHLLNTVLVYVFILLLCKKKTIALAVSLLFGIHPMHVESVAWASGLKDLLYTFFFLASVIFYLKYLDLKQKKYYLLSLLLFPLSLLSKAMAAPLPVVLLLIDYFKNRKFNLNVWLEKLPFVLMAAIVGTTAVLAQQSANAIHTEAFPFSQRIVFACYGFINYLFKLVLPVQLSSYYPYPISSGENLPAVYYLYVPLLIGFITFTFYTLRHYRLFFFCITFFTLTVFLVLQLLPIGGTIIADRFSYVPSIGIFYLVAEGLYLLWKKTGIVNFKLPFAILSAVAVILLSIKTYSQCAIWKDEFTLWNEVINNTQKVPLAYCNRGLSLMAMKREEDALKDFTKTIELMQDYPKAYNSRGIIFQNRHQNKEALDDFTKAIELKPDYVNAYINRGNVLRDEKKYPEAANDYSKAISLEPNSAIAYYNQAVNEFYLGEKEKSCADFQHALELGYGPSADALKQAGCR